MATRQRHTEPKAAIDTHPVAPNAFDPSKVRELTIEEGWELLDTRARRVLGISAEEFIRKWDAGEFGDPDDVPGIWDVGGLLPFVGKNPFV